MTAIVLVPSRLGAACASCGRLHQGQSVQTHCSRFGWGIPYAVLVGLERCALRRPVKARPRRRRQLIGASADKPVEVNVVIFL